MSNAVIINNCEVELEVVGDQTYTTSLAIANVFNKRHDHIIAKIRELPQDEFTAPIFRVSEYTDKSGRKLPMYEMTKDGFVLLAMGFTGEKAYKFKIEYINAFNRMADEIKRLKFEAYVNKIAELDAVLIDKTKRHRREISGYKGKLTQANNEIVALRRDLASVKDPKLDFDATTDYKAMWKNTKLERDYYFDKYKKLSEKNTQKENKCVKALDETQKRFEEIFTAIGAVKAYIFDNDEFFMKNNALLA
nr:MAG TPA: regulatory protein [Caudoviricetes sp.]